MREVVIGIDGFIGSAMAVKLPNAVHTTHKPFHVDGRWPFDLLDFGPLPSADVVYICAGFNGQKKCEGNPVSHHVNVDATIRLAKHYINEGAFPVWISSRSLEWCNSAYSRQKMFVESVFHLLPVGIVRAGRVTPDNLDDLCDTLIAVGRSKRCGLTVWGTDEISYDKVRRAA